jgi:hypothetical protein
VGILTQHPGGLLQGFLKRKALELFPSRFLNESTPASLTDTGIDGLHDLVGDNYMGPCHRTS